MELYDRCFDSLERSFRIIRSEERLSVEASVEELCKVLLLKLFFERKNGVHFLPFAADLRASSEPMSSFYKRYFSSYVPAYEFKEWDSSKLSKKTFWMVSEELSSMNMSEVITDVYGKAFTAFLQKHYSGYLSEYSTPQKLNKFIFDVLGIEKMSNLADPCCGLGGTLVEAANRTNGRIHLKGFDINPRMANTAKLQMLLYGYDASGVECTDMLNMARSFVEEQYYCIVAHLPQLHQGFSIAGRRDLFYGYASRSLEDVYIRNILNMLMPDGIAALVVSDELLESDKRYESRRWLYEKARILNITKFEGLAYDDGGTMRTYNVVFLKKNIYASSDVCSTAFIGKGEEEKEIGNIAALIRDEIYAPEIVTKDKAIKYFRLLDKKNWNISLLYLQEKIGVNYPAVTLGDVISHNRERIKNIVDDDYYTLLTVKNKGLGVVKRGELVQGIHLPKDAKYIAHGGQLIVSAIDAKKGAIGIVPKDLDGALVTRNYNLFSIDTEKVNPDYLSLILCTDPVSQQMSALNQRDYIMARLSIEKILSVVIPLPDIDTQVSLSKTMMRNIKKIQKAQEELEEEQEVFCKKIFGV